MFEFISKNKKEIVELADVSVHSYNVKVIASIIASEMGLDYMERKVISCVGVYHDIGKGYVKQELLYKPVRLNAKELNEIKRHASLGSEYMKRNKHLRGYAEFVLLHHENMDGTGYYNLSGDNIPLVSRIIRIADYFDAMCTDKTYRDAYTICETLNAMEKDLQKFDPAAFKIFINIFEKKKELEGRILLLYGGPFTIQQAPEYAQI